MNIYIVDAFTNQPFKGNPAGVCIVDEFPDVSVMQSIAMELNCSNTAFTKKLQYNHHYHIRWFTPVSEAPLCGHATIATLHILNEKGYLPEGYEINFESLSGIITGSKDDGWYRLNFPAFDLKTVEPTEQLLEVVGGISPIFTGFARNCYFMELSGYEEVLNLQPRLNLLSEIDCRALIVTASGSKYDFHSRYFAPGVGINEDPVCASAHCLLIPYWAKKLQKNEMIAQQLSKRSGIIKCKNLTNRVLISGEAVTVMKVDFNINLPKGLKNVA